MAEKKSIDVNFKYGMHELMTLGKALVDIGDTNGFVGNIVRYYLSNDRTKFYAEQQAKEDAYEKKNAGYYKFAKSENSQGFVAIEYQKIQPNYKTGVVDSKTSVPYQIVLTFMKDKVGGTKTFKCPSEASALGEMILEVTKKTFNYALEHRVSSNENYQPKTSSPNMDNNSNMNQSTQSKKSYVPEPPVPLDNDMSDDGDFF